MSSMHLVNVWLKFAQRQIRSALVPKCCMICYAPCNDGLQLCQQCYQDLPRIEHGCRHCACPLPQGDDICGSCLQKPMFDRAYAAFEYAWPLNKFIYQLKFKHQLAYGPMLGALMVKALEVNTAPQAFIPVPLHTKRYLERGFNQAYEIAKILSEFYQVPLLSGEVIRQKPTKPQSKINKNIRKLNLRNAFAVKEKIDYHHVAIIDDVVTTGETARALAKLLLKNGCETVECWSCCRTPPR